MLVVWGLGGVFFWKAWRAWQTGYAPTKSVFFGRQQYPAVFWLVIGLFIFGGSSFMCWGFLMIGMMGIYVVERLVQLVS